MNTIIENQLIEQLARSFPRSPDQLNTLQDSDAEIVRLNAHGALLALTMDSIAEEIEAGLYRDPFLIGWMTVIVNASDLAAVGADPVGLLINETLPADADQPFLERLQKGIAQAAKVCDLPVLGGDTNWANHTELSACAIGVLNGNAFLKRTGSNENDLLFASGKLGLGNAFAFVQLQNLKIEIPYRPEPRFAQSKIIRAFASCCMDSSDGFLATVDQLMRLNDLGFDVSQPMESYLHPAALQLCEQVGLPMSAMLAGPHGEFELIFTVPQEKEQAFRRQAQAINWQPVLLGRATAAPNLRMKSEMKIIEPDTAYIRNLFEQNRGQVASYMHQLIGYLKAL